MRGKLMCTGRGSVSARIIPAHAGQTVEQGVDGVEFADHPRACGANAETRFDYVAHRGSSPRMRGKLTVLGDAIGQVRIIPAHAGQTPGARVCVALVADHPRACGANSSLPCSLLPAVGSSPRMRGKLDGFTAAAKPARIIPAHAGQTAFGSSRRRGEADHPRACGANARIDSDCVVFNGSSPRMRGKPAQRHGGQALRRIIPAHAGQTPSCPQPSQQDHGSSPRMRGKLGVEVDDAAVVRIIPAHAGQTKPLPAAIYDRTDHPRACGANP